MCKGPGHGEGTFSRTQSSVWPGMAGGKAGVVGQSQIVGKLRKLGFIVKTLEALEDLSRGGKEKLKFAFEEH